MPTEYPNEMRFGYRAIDSVFKFADETNDVVAVTIIVLGAVLLSFGYLVGRRGKLKPGCE